MYPDALLVFLKSEQEVFFWMPAWRLPTAMCAGLLFDKNEKCLE